MSFRILFNKEQNLTKRSSSKVITLNSYSSKLLNIFASILSLNFVTFCVSKSWLWVKLAAFKILWPVPRLTYRAVLLDACSSTRLLDGINVTITWRPPFFGTSSCKVSSYNNLTRICCFYVFLLIHIIHYIEFHSTRTIFSLKFFCY